MADLRAVSGGGGGGGGGRGLSQRCAQALKQCGFSLPAVDEREAGALLRRFDRDGDGALSLTEWVCHVPPR
jgi:hypothetical protein